MNWRIGQYILFKNKVSKITNIGKTGVSFRNFSKGNTKDGYSWQHNCSKKHLTKLLMSKKLRCISTEEVLKTLFKRYVKTEMQK